MQNIATDHDVVTLIGPPPRDEHLRLPFEVWEAALRLAANYGWQPQGTAPPPELWESEDPQAREERFEAASAAWSGSYLARRRETVDFEDAAGLAEALERAAAEVPKLGEPAHARSGTGCGRPELLNWFAPRKALLRELAAFCARDDFEIA